MTNVKSGLVIGAFLVSSALLRGGVEIVAFVLTGCVFHDAALGVEDALRQIVGVVSFAEHLLQLNLLFVPELEQSIVHELHAKLGARLNGRADAESLVLAD